jgi:hypothetical protein
VRKCSRQRLFEVLLLSACGLEAIPACGSTGRIAPSVQVTQVIGPSGGKVTSTDGNATIEIPAAALSADTSISIESAPQAPPPPAATLVSTPFTFHPEGQRFLQPVKVTLAFDPALLPASATSNDVVIYTAPEGSADYASLATTLSDRSQVVAAVTHFSTFVAAVAQPSAQTIADAASSSPIDPLCASGGLVGANPPYVTCQNTQVCPSGTYTVSCVNTQTGYMATCCPIRDGSGAGASLGSGCSHSGGVAGKQPGVDAAPPSCSSAPPCPVGAYLQSCTDMADGFDEVCCSLDGG